MSAVLQTRLELLPMQTSDLSAVMEIENDVYPFPWTEGNFRDALKAGYSGWIFRADGVTIGYAMLMLVVDEVHLLNISIARACHGRGYGASLLRHAMDVARHGGAGSMLLEVRPSNLPALKLYENFGFIKVGTRRGYYPAAVGREDAIVLRRSLGEVCA